MAINKPKKPTKKDLVYNIALLRQEMFRLTEKMLILESVINKYIEMKKDTEKFNKYLTSKIEKRANEKETKDTK
tara:strand:- start:864 stop:1085 length:222 start_codon:yes stop_codon:yes gene_type:complete